MSLGTRSQSVVLVLAAIGCAVLVVWSPSASPERIIAAFLLTLALPGAIVVQVLPGRRRGRAESLLLVLGVSVSVVILDSALLYVLGIRLGLRSWAWSLTAVIVLTGLASLVGQRSERQDPTKLSLGRCFKTRYGLRIVAGAALCVVALTVATALITGHSVTRNEQSDQFTQLWALPGANGADRVWRLSSASGGRAITVGLFNHEGRPERYRLGVRRHGQLLRSGSVSLQSGERWSGTVEGLPHGAVQVNLVGSDPNSVHRWVRLRLR